MVTNKVSISSITKILVMVSYQSLTTMTMNLRTWNTGNGSPDAICFSVDRPGVMITGAGVYGGVGTFDYELELLSDQSSAGGQAAAEKDSTQSQRWLSKEMCHGTYSSDDCANDIAWDSDKSQNVAIVIYGWSRRPISFRALHG